MSEKTSSAGDPSDSSVQWAAYRILDANLNRGLEGLRVVEEYLRFALEDDHLATHCKTLRHDLASLAAGLNAHHLHAARDVVGDVGTAIATASEYRRTNLVSVAAANLKRVQQALRGLEEYSKVVAPDLSASIEQLRYRTYTLERSITLLRTSLQRLESACLYVLVDGCDSPSACEQLVGLLLTAGADVIQLRDKRLPDRLLLQRARLVRRMTREQGRLFIMNDRVDLALLADADGVHVGQEEISVSDARRLMGPEALIGVSTHSLDQARQAVLDGANYLGCGPTFTSATKSFSQLAGIGYLQQVAGEIRLPAFAIGGIDTENVAEVKEAGFSRIAVSHSVVGADDPARALRTLRARLGG